MGPAARDSREGIQYDLDLLLLSLFQEFREAVVSPKHSVDLVSLGASQGGGLLIGETGSALFIVALLVVSLECPHEVETVDALGGVSFYFLRGLQEVSSLGGVSCLALTVIYKQFVDLELAAPLGVDYEPALHLLDLLHLLDARQTLVHVFHVVDLVHTLHLPVTTETHQFPVEVAAGWEDS